MSILAIDADSILYKAGFAVEHNVYDIVPKSAAHLVDDKDVIKPYIIKTFRYVKEYKAWLKEVKKEETDFLRITRKEMEPLEYAFNIINTMIKAQIALYQPEQVIIYLTGTDNFREKIATLQEYKINRKDKPKPIYFDKLKEFIIGRWKAVVVNGMEADDACSILAHSCFYSDQICTIASIDKDLKSVPGWNYNYDKQVTTYISEEEATRWFYIQLLAGDSTDGVVGIPGVAEKTARKLLDHCVTEYEMYEVAVDQYDQAYGNQTKFSKQISGKILTEMAQLVYMLKNVNEMWTPPQKG